MENYRSIDLNEWRKTGAGSYADTYTCDDESLLLRLCRKNATLESVLDDFTRDVNVSSLGIVTAAAREIVKVGDSFGLIYQNIKNKKSYSRMIADDPEHLHEYAVAFAERAKELHATPCDTELFEGISEKIRKGIDMAKFMNKYKPELYKVVDEMAEHTTCLHGDMQTGNLINADGKDYWIDFDRFTYGDPIMDIAHMYTVYVSMSWFFFIQNLFHMNKKLLNRFWDEFMEAYYGFSKSETKKFNKTLKIYNALDLIQRNYIKPGLLSDMVTLILVRPQVGKYVKSLKK